MSTRFQYLRIYDIEIPYRKFYTYNRKNKSARLGYNHVDYSRFPLTLASYHTDCSTEPWAYVEVRITQYVMEAIWGHSIYKDVVFLVWQFPL